MSDSSLSDYRQEVQGFLESCEYLSAATASSDNPPLSRENGALLRTTQLKS